MNYPQYIWDDTNKMVLERNEDCEYLECLDFSQWQQLDNMAIGRIKVLIELANTGNLGGSQ